MTWVQPKFSSLDQMSLTLTGLLVHCVGACLTGKNKLLDAAAESAETSAPGYFQLAVRMGPCGTGPDFKTRFQIFGESVAVIFRHQRRLEITADLHRAFGQELLEVGPETFGHKTAGGSKLRYRGAGVPGVPGVLPCVG